MVRGYIIHLAARAVLSIEFANKICSQFSLLYKQWLDLHSASSSWKWDYARKEEANFSGTDALFEATAAVDPRGPRLNYTGQRARSDVLDEARSSACSPMLTQLDYEKLVKAPTQS